MVNRPMAKKAISQIINQWRTGHGRNPKRSRLLDQLMYTGYEYSTRPGCPSASPTFVIPEEKARLIDGSQPRPLKEIEDQFAPACDNHGEKYNKIIDIWSRANDLVSVDDGAAVEGAVDRAEREG